MLEEQIQVQSSVSDEIKILASVSALDNTFVQSPFEVSRCVDNCLEGTKQDCQTKQICFYSKEVKDDFQRLSGLYEKEKNSLTEMEEKYSIEQKFKMQMINKLHTSLNQIYQNQSSRDRKGSQISTAGEDEQTRTHYVQGQSKIIDDSYETIMMLEGKLQKLKNGNFRKNQKQNQKIAQLKRLLSGTEKYQSHCKENQRQQQSVSEVKSDLHLKIVDLGKKRSQLIAKKESLESKILVQKTKLKQLQNKTEYILQTQNCCQEILDQELKVISDKLSSRRSEYDATKRYTDKITKQRKYQENVSFKQIQNQIAYLNNYCDEMIHKKNHILQPDIKKYKHKRRTIVQQISQNYELIKQFDLKKNELNKNLHQQNYLYAQVQGQYCLLIENAEHSQNPQQKLMFFQQKRQELAQELQQIIIRIQEAQQQIDTNQNLVPQNIVKDLQKRIKKKRIQFQNYENILKQGIQLQNQNRILQEQKDQIQGKTNHELQELIEEENLLIQSQNIIKDSIQTFQEQNEAIQKKLSKFQEFMKTKPKIQENNHLSSQIQKQNLKDTEKNKKQRQTQIKQKKSYEGKKSMQKIIQKFKKSKDQYSNNERTQKQMRSSKSKGSSCIKQTAIEKLRKQFPINSSQETFNNSSLLVSNPASWMLVIFVVLVIPGLCIGYNF